MPYKIASTEKLNNSASTAETKALLYLMNFRADSNEINYFVIDFFNDVTGMDQLAQKMWDVQSKSSNNVSPKQIGKNLVTLYKNYLSDFIFNYYILFMGEPSSSVRTNNDKNSFGIDNVNANALKKIVQGLKEEAQRITYIPNEKISDASIQNFLQSVLFVIDDKCPCDYIRPIIKVKPELIPDNDTLSAIFNEIRNEQSSKKNGKPVEGITINVPHEALDYYRHLDSNEIKMLILSRVINKNPMEQNAPLAFNVVLDCVPPEKKRDCIENCRIALSRALFDKTSSDIYWDVLSEVLSLIKNYPQEDINQLYTHMNSTLKSKCRNFDVFSMKFFIANIKDGVEL